MKIKGDSNQKSSSSEGGEKRLGEVGGFLSNDEWEVPEMLGKKRRESVGELIKNSPEQAVSVIREWLNIDRG